MLTYAVQAVSFALGVMLMMYAGSDFGSFDWEVLHTVNLSIYGGLLIGFSRNPEHYLGQR